MNQSNQNNQKPLPSNPQDRKERPMYRGLLAYFPDALAAIANVSHVGNEQHNPGEEMHWARNKSKDHADCIIRHLVEQGTTDDDGLLHSAKMAWRALALLQIEVEQRQNKIPDFKPITVGDYWDGVPHARAARKYTTAGRSVYIAGPMRGIKDFNFPAFDTARELAIATGWTPISPADIDRDLGIKETTALESVSGPEASRTFAARDCKEIIALHAELGDAIAMLPGWTKSTGARAEFFLADWVGLRVLNALTMEPFTVQEQKTLWDNTDLSGLGELKASSLRIISKGA